MCTDESFRSADSLIVVVHWSHGHELQCSAIQISLGGPVRSGFYGFSFEGVTVQFIGADRESCEHTYPAAVAVWCARIELTREGPDTLAFAARDVLCG